MVKVGSRELKNRLSHYVDVACRGERVIVTKRGRPVAELRRFDESAEQDADVDLQTLRRLSSEGRVSLPKNPRAPADGWKAEPTGRSASDLILEEREQDR